MPQYQVAATDSADIRKQKADKLADRQKLDVKCKSVLIRNIADSQLECIKGKRSPVEIWTTLRNTYARKGISGQFYLLKKLSTMKFDESGSLQAHLMLFDRMVSDLDSAGIKLQEKLVVFYLLQTMPSSYSQLVTVLETLAADQCTLDFVRARLLNESVKRDHTHECEGGGASTAFAGKSGNFSGKKIKCFSCGRIGHKRSDCPSRKDVESGRDSKKNGKKKQNAHCSETEVTFVSDSLRGNDGDSARLKWILDSGASDHMVCAKDWLRDVQKLEEPVIIKVASGQTLQCRYVGKVIMVTKIGERELKCTVERVLYVPELSYNLFSIRRVSELDMQVVFDKDKALIKREGRVLCTGSRHDRLYELNVRIQKVSQSEVFVAEKSMDGEELWHRRFGHIGGTGLKKILIAGMVKGMDLEQKAVRGDHVCEPCMIGKQTRMPFVEMPLPRSTRPLELIHSDVCGAMTPAAWNGKRYFLSFTDDYTHFSAVYFLNTKDEVLEMFKTYVAMAENHFDSRISRSCCDNGGEYVGHKFRDFCKVKGIQIEFTVPYTPQQNGVSERLNRTVMDKARAMIADAGMSKKMWCEAVLTAVYLINRSPTAALTENRTPYEMWYGHKPDVSK